MWIIAQGRWAALERSKGYIQGKQGLRYPISYVDQSPGERLGGLAHERSGRGRRPDGHTQVSSQRVPRSPESVSSAHKDW